METIIKFIKKTIALVKKSVKVSKQTLKKYILYN